jgi:hypothetical protein
LQTARLDGIAEHGKSVIVDTDLERFEPRRLNVCGNRSHNNSMMAPTFPRLAVLLMVVWS